MCRFFGPRTDSMKHDLSPWGTGRIGKFNVRGGLHSELGDGFRVRIWGIPIWFKVWSFGVGLWGFRILEFGV
jgi:hypothetical protein